MSFGPIKVFTVSIASGASTPSTISMDRGYSRVYAEVSSMSTAAALAVYGSTDGTSFRPVFERVNTAPVQYQALVIATNAANGVAPIDCVFPFVQFRASATVTDGVTIKLICVD